jgi:hypothetical protein
MWFCAPEATGNRSEKYFATLDTPGSANGYNYRRRELGRFQEPTKYPLNR